MRASLSHPGPALPSRPATTPPRIVAIPSGPRRRTAALAAALASLPRPLVCGCGEVEGVAAGVGVATLSAPGRAVLRAVCPGCARGATIHALPCPLVFSGGTLAPMPSTPRPGVRPARASASLDAPTLAALRARVEADGLRATARALDLPPPTLARAAAGEGVSRGTAAAVRAGLDALARAA